MDPQFRIVVPQKFREAMDNGVVLARGIDGCIEAYPPREFEEVSERVKGFSPYNKNGRVLRRLTFSGAFNAAPDRHGRMVLPQFLREYAGISDEVVMTGQHNYFEIWSPERWRVQEANGANLPEIAEALGKGDS